MPIIDDSLDCIEYSGTCNCDFSWHNVSADTVKFPRVGFNPLTSVHCKKKIKQNTGLSGHDDRDTDLSNGVTMKFQAKEC